MHLLHCDHQDDALLEAAVSAAASCAAYAPQRSLLHAHGIERAAGKCAQLLHALVHLCSRCSCNFGTRPRFLEIANLVSHQPARHAHVGAAAVCESVR